jgi:hypothetical protein
MSTAAHLRKLYVKSTNAAPSGSDEIDGGKEFTFTRSRDVLDTTDTKDGDQRTKLLGLKDGTGSISGDWEHGDAAQALLLSSHDSGAVVYVTDLPDGTNGFTYPCLVESVETGGQVDGLVSRSFSLTQSGAAIVRP